MDDYNLKRIADALEDIAREMKFKRETDNEGMNRLNLKIDILVEEVSSIKKCFCDSKQDIFQ